MNHSIRRVWLTRSETTPHHRFDTLDAVKEHAKTILVDDQLLSTWQTYMLELNNRRWLCGFYKSIDIVVIGSDNSFNDYLDPTDDTEYHPNIYSFSSGRSSDPNKPLRRVIVILNYLKADMEHVIEPYLPQIAACVNIEPEPLVSLLAAVTSDDPTDSYPRFYVDRHGNTNASRAWFEFL